jgi:hypothetical protein
LREKKKGMDKLKKQNQLLVDENLAMKKLLENGDQPKPAPLSATVAVVKVWAVCFSFGDVILLGKDNTCIRLDI